MPRSARRPANTETQAGARPASASVARDACSPVKIAVTLTFTPSPERLRMASYSGSPLVFVTGSLT